MLDEMYTNVSRHFVLEDCDEEDRSEVNRLFRQIVGCIVLPQAPSAPMPRGLHKLRSRRGNRKGKAKNAKDKRLGDIKY
jgi:hypothetical protein